MEIRRPFNVFHWLDTHRGELKPPVANRNLFPDAEDFIVMVVAGPNARKDYHYNETEEWFLQLEGDITVRIQENGKPVDVPIRQGEIFLLPARTPHSPIRPAGTVGLVIETRRRPQDQDGLMWFCDQCNHKLYEEFFALENIETQFGAVFERFYRSIERRTCGACGHLNPAPARFAAG